MTKKSVQTIRKRLELTVDTEGTVDLMDFFCNSGPYLLELVDEVEKLLTGWETKLELLAEWLDVTDRPGQGNNVQQDLRRWATEIKAWLEKVS